jgi:hypothetical protein
VGVEERGEVTLLLPALGNGGRTFRYREDSGFGGASLLFFLSSYCLRLMKVL